MLALIPVNYVEDGLTFKQIASESYVIANEMMIARKKYLDPPIKHE